MIGFTNDPRNLARTLRHLTVVTAIFSGNMAPFGTPQVLAQEASVSPWDSPSDEPLNKGLHEAMPADQGPDELDPLMWAGRENGERVSLALFGDSASMATMADARFGNPGPRFYADFVGSGMLAAVYDKLAAPWQPHPTEEDQHQLINRLFGNMTRKHLSPFLGWKDYSILPRIAALTGSRPVVYNGAQLAGAYYFGQVYLDKFAAFLAKNPGWAQTNPLIIVNFNGMDFIANHGVDVYATKVREFYTRLTALAPDSTIVVTGIGDPVALLTHPDRVAVEKSPIGAIKCSDIYKFLRFGNGLGLKPGATEEEKVAARALLARFRAVLEKEVDLIQNDRQLYPDFRGRTVYVAPQDGRGPTPDMIAADCIHPNVDAQRQIGEAMWEVIQPLLP